jgi:hypothetical protein
MQEVTSRIDRRINDQLRVYAALKKVPLGRLTNQILQDWLDNQPAIALQKPQKELVSAGWES